MKILLVGTFTPETNYTRDLSVYLSKVIDKNDEMYLCGYRGEKVLDDKLPKVDHVWDKSWKYIPQILAYVLKVKPDVIHFQHEFKMYGGLISAALYPLLLAILRLLGYPLVVTIHGVVDKKQIDKDFLQSFNVTPNFLMRSLAIAFFSYVYFSVTLLANKTTVHAPMLKKILEKYNSFSRDNIVVIDHGVRELNDIGSVKIKNIYKKYPILKNKKVILVFGLFSPRKDYEFLLSSFASVLGKTKNKKWILALVGDVKDEFLPYKVKMVNFIKRLKIQKNVLISGYVNGQELDEFYRLADIEIIPAIISFNTSGALSLALAYKKPLLVSNVKPLSDEISRNNFGLLYDKSGPKSLENQMEKLINNRKMYDILIGGMEKSVEKRYWTKISNDHYRLYKSLITK